MSWINAVMRRDSLMTNHELDKRSLQTFEEAILRAVHGIRFGSVEIVIHDSKVVQIERKEKMRFEGSLQKSNR